MLQICSECLLTPFIQFILLLWCFLLPEWDLLRLRSVLADGGGLLYNTPISLPFLWNVADPNFMIIQIDRPCPVLGDLGFLGDLESFDNFLFECIDHMHEECGLGEIVD